MARPEISFAAPEVAYARRYQEADLSMRVLCFGREAQAGGGGEPDQRQG